MPTSKNSRSRFWPSRWKRHYIARLIRWSLAGIFFYSGAVKLLDPQRFAEIISGFGLLPKTLLHPVAIGLPLLELLAGIGLCFAMRGSLTAIALMLVLFMAVLAYGIHLGLDIDCGCFGPEDPEQAYKSLRVALIRDAVMMAAVCFLYWHNWKSTQSIHPSTQPLPKEHP
jgi:uncharacterized membrane protein YphA (DoxX/SURF4 family)